MTLSRNAPMLTWGGGRGPLAVWFKVDCGGAVRFTGSRAQARHHRPSLLPRQPPVHSTQNL